MTDLIPTERQFPELTDMQEAFVWALLVDGATDKAAAIAAGYAKESASVTASKLKRSPKVIRAIHEASVLTLGALSPAAVMKIARLSSSAKSEYVQLEASKDLLDRIGMSAPKKINLGGNVSVTIDLS